MVLLTLLLNRLPPSQVGVIHCDHGLRQQSEHVNEAALVWAYCEKLGVKYYYKRLGVRDYVNEHRVSEEMAARDCRYVAYRSVMDEHGYDVLALGHHLDDHIETLVLQLVRGTFSRFVGIQPVSEVNGVSVVRPLRNWRRAQIADYATAHSISFLSDSSNSNLKYDRNMIRHLLLPLLRIGYPDCDGALLRLESHVSTIIQASLSRFSDDFVDRGGNGDIKWRFERSVFQNESVFDGAVFLSHHWHSLMGVTQTDPNETIIRNIVEAVHSREYHALPFGDYYVCMDQELVMLRRLDKGRQTTESYVVSMEGHLKNNAFQLHSRCVSRPSSDEYKSASPHTVFLSVPSKTEVFELRRVRPDDVFKPLGAPGSKRVLDYLSDKKCGKLNRDRAWVLTMNSAVAWVVGWQIADEFKIKPESESFVRLDFESF